MNKRNTRAFAFGILIAAFIIGAFYFSKPSLHTENGKTQDITQEEAEEFLTNEGFIILTKEQHQELSTAKEDTKEEIVIKEEKTAEINLEKAGNAEPLNSYQLEIVSGMNPSEIATMLAQATIVDSAEDFETYLEEFGYSTKIQLGTFEFKPEMSYKDIAKLITKS